MTRTILGKFGSVVANMVVMVLLHGNSKQFCVQRQSLWPGRFGFWLATILVMIILHGNSRQPWPKVPYLSLRDESPGEHARLLLNTLMVITVAQAATGHLPRHRWPGRLAALIALPVSLPTLIWLGDVAGLAGKHAEVYHLGLVPVLPVAAIALEEAVGRLVR
ncbi:MAG: hypothetical protein WCG26_16475 [Chloroflexales bacterium]